MNSCSPARIWIVLGLLAIAPLTSCQQMAQLPQPEANNPPAESVATAQTETVQRTAPLDAQPGDPDYVAKIVEQVGPTVVRIDASRVVDQPFGDRGLDSLFGRRGGGQERVQRGTGSGFIATADGRIYTNSHVVAGADNVSVLLKDGRRFKGQVVGADPTADIAVVKINVTGLPVAKLGDSDSLLPGQAAIAIGNPLGLDNSVTQGIISATGRSGADFGGSARVDFIQTDTAINPGNSGGPLINSRGEVIGINTAIIQGASGIGFAVPIATAQRIADQLITKGRVDHPYLGIQMAEITPELKDQINNSSDVRIDRDQGVIILAVQPNSPAAQAGIRPGDIVETINGTKIETPKQVQRQVEATEIGNTLQMTVNRSGKSQTLTVKPAPSPEPPA
jgi:S1-C subfamily serine protease